MLTIDVLSSDIHRGKSSGLTGLALEPPRGQVYVLGKCQMFREIRNKALQHWHRILRIADIVLYPREA
jgi:hypothetical protein